MKTMNIIGVYAIMVYGFITIACSSDTEATRKNLVDRQELPLFSYGLIVDSVNGIIIYKSEKNNVLVLKSRTESTEASNNMIPALINNKDTFKSLDIGDIVTIKGTIYETDPGVIYIIHLDTLRIVIKNKGEVQEVNLEELTNKIAEVESRRKKARDNEPVPYQYNYGIH